jgi:L-ascorbate metabolism protein UlaG (beta-lactamase superfamily)
MPLGRDTAITWHGHATVEIETPGGKRILIDPWLEGNPSFHGSLDDLARPDVILVTHGHSDHINDAVAVANRHSAPVYALNAVASWLAEQGVEQATGFNKGGTVDLGGPHATQVHALHSSGLPDGSYGGEAAGYVLVLENGFTIYVAGDTDVFGDMRLIGEIYQPELAILPIGDHYTMGPRQAAQAIRLLGVRKIIPYHFGTFPLLRGTPEELREAAADVDGLEVFALRPGETLR